MCSSSFKDKISWSRLFSFPKTLNAASRPERFLHLFFKIIQLIIICSWAIILLLNSTRFPWFLVPAKGPTITSITSPTSTELKVTWGNLTEDDANGIITNYSVCYQVTGSEKDSCTNSITVIGGSTTTATLMGLNEATTYDVAVKAATAVGFGVLGDTMVKKTLEDGKCRKSDAWSLSI